MARLGRGERALQTEATAGGSEGRGDAAFSRPLALALCGVVVLMAATLFATWWMAREQDRLAQANTRRMVVGGLDAFGDRTRGMLRDYAIWTDAYEHALADDRPWMDENIGSSTGIGTFDAAYVFSPGRPPVGWIAGGDPAELDALAPDAEAAAAELLDPVPIDSGAARSAYLRAGDGLWFLTAGRITPQDGPPPGAVDADLPRLVIGFRMSSDLVSRIGGRFLIDDLAITPDPLSGKDAMVLEGLDGAPAGYVAWTSPTPGRAMLAATLWPLVGLMLGVAVIVLLVSRELMRSARRLEGALERAKAADRIKTEFLSNVSHELRTPLNGVIGVGQLLQLRALDEESRQMVDVLLAAARSQLQLVDGLLDITRIETGAMTLEREPYDPAAVLEGTVQLVAPEIARKRLALEVRIAPEARRLMLGDALAFRQIATNLLGNALKFTEEGGIAVDLAAPGSAVLILVVADSGIGIDPCEHARIFERFVQAEGAARRRVGGTGLGLAITRRLVEMKGGTIRVASAPGAGATFTVELPLLPVDAVASAA